MAQIALISFVNSHNAPAGPSGRERHNPLIRRIKNPNDSNAFILPSENQPSTLRYSASPRSEQSPAARWSEHKSGAPYSMRQRAARRSAPAGTCDDRHSEETCTGGRRDGRQRWGGAYTVLGGLSRGGGHGVRRDLGQAGLSRPCRYFTFGLPSSWLVGRGDATCQCNVRVEFKAGCFACC
jgi:hypothetical protein